MSPAVAELGAVVLDCPDPRELADFYGKVLGGTIKGDGRWIDLEGPGGRTVLSFQAAPGYVPPRWPASDASQQFHLDLTVDDLDEAEKHVLALGARLLDTEKGNGAFRVYADPAGHPFCLCVN